MVAAIPGIDDLSMTTNGTLLARHAADLAAASLQRVNISLDTLQPDRYQQMTRRGRLEDVLSGVEAAQAAGLAPVKFKTVVVRGLNDDEVVDFARCTERFCSSCDRLCLTADGRLRPCLLSEAEIDLRAPLRASANLETIRDILARAMASKPARHHLDEALPPQARSMAEIGG